MVTSTSTPGSREMEVICLTTSAEELRSMRRLWIRIWYLSQVLEPSPQGLKELFISPHFLPARSIFVENRKKGIIKTYDFLVVCLRTLVGSRTGPLTLRSRSLARLMRSAQTIENSISISPLVFKNLAMAQSKKKKLTLLKRLDVLGGQGDPDLVDLLGTGASLFEVFLVLGHFCL